MKPYYQESGITIYHGDCRDILASVPVCDLLLTDPPYGISYRSNYTQGRMFITGDSDSTDVVELLRLALARLVPQRHVYVFGPLDLSTLPIYSTVEIAWDKGRLGLGDLSLPWAQSHERITFGVYSTRKDAQSRNRGALAARLRRGSVISCGQYPELHPTEKPILLLRQLIEASSLIGDTVLDPFMGAGSSLVASRLEGRKAIGIEIEEKYCEIAADRLRQEVLQFG
jgi:site-specific DNA-methyltransferase (adenine-specific)